MRTTPPETLEGAQVWDLVARLGGQMRVVVGLEGAVVTGWDMNAALALGAALGIAPVVLAECLPPSSPSSAASALPRGRSSGR